MTLVMRAVPTGGRISCRVITSPGLRCFQCSGVRGISLTRAHSPGFNGSRPSPHREAMLTRDSPSGVRRSMSHMGRSDPPGDTDSARPPSSVRTRQSSARRAPVRASLLRHSYQPASSRSHINRAASASRLQNLAAVGEHHRDLQAILNGLERLGTATDIAIGQI